jgi:hypothetical protein
VVSRHNDTLKRPLKYFLFAITINSCSVDDVSQTDVAEKSSDSTIEATIVGTWTISREINDSIEVLCNVCPEIQFFYGAKAVAGKTDTLKYRIQDDTLIINNQNNDSLFDYIVDGKYNMTLKATAKSQELKLRHNKLDRLYVLNR